MAPVGGGPMAKTLSRGSEVYSVNDHVYLSAPWNTAEGAPWLIGRIVEFLDGASGDVTKLRVAYYLRPRDLNNRQVVDFRLLTASMHTEVCSASYLRGKCRVLHRDQIDDLDSYKQQPDCFYFYQLYGRYLHRYYDVVPTSKVENSAPEIIDHLRSHFSFVFAEIGMASQLTDERRGCSTCRQWTTGSDSINCGLCGRCFHLACLDPPLTSKPARGYAWACAPCSKRPPGQKVDLKKADGPVASIAAAQPSRKGKGRAADAEADTLVTTNGWPYRYFGLHVEPSAVLDPHDSLYPRAATRLGARFQAVLPNEQDPPKPSKVEAALKARLGKRSRDGTPLSASARTDDGELTRGGDETVQTIWRPSAIDDDELFAYLSRAVEVPVASVVGVDLIDKALALRLTSADSASALATLRTLTAKDFNFNVWTDAESARFDSLMLTLREDLESIAASFTRKSQADVVKFFYMNKASSQPDGPSQDQDQFQDSLPVVSLNATEETTKTPDEDSVVGSPPPAKRPRSCALCETKTSDSWWTCPNAIGVAVPNGGRKCLCDTCSTRWRKYGLQHPASQDEAIKNPKSRRLLKSTLKNMQSRAGSPDSVKPLPKPCLLCKRLEPKTQLAQCRNCTLAAHVSCYGVPDGTALDDWKCYGCQHEATAEASRVHACVLCPPPPAVDPDDALAATNILKPTENGGLVHLLCAVWHSELGFSVSSQMQVVEGITAIAPAKRARECAICGVKDVGACLKCDGCNKHVHVACAWAAGYRFAFEVQPLKKRRQKEAKTITFKEETGLLEPKIWCKSHHISTDARPVYDMGQKDSATSLTALQMYVRTYKDASQDDFALLRRARRLDPLIEPVLKPLTAAMRLGIRNNDPEDDYLLAALGRIPDDYRAAVEEAPPGPTAPAPRERKKPAKVRESEEPSSTPSLSKAAPKEKKKRTKKTAAKGGMGPPPPPMVEDPMAAFAEGTLEELAQQYYAIREPAAEGEQTSPRGGRGRGRGRGRARAGGVTARGGSTRGQGRGRGGSTRGTSRGTGTSRGGGVRGKKARAANELDGQDPGMMPEWMEPTFVVEDLDADGSDGMTILQSSSIESTPYHPASRKADQGTTRLSPKETAGRVNTSTNELAPGGSRSRRNSYDVPLVSHPRESAGPDRAPASVDDLAQAGSRPWTDGVRLPLGKADLEDQGLDSMDLRAPEPTAPSIAESTSGGGGPKKLILRLKEPAEASTSTSTVAAVPSGGPSGSPAGESKKRKLGKGKGRVDGEPGSRYDADWDAVPHSTTTPRDQPPQQAARVLKRPPKLQPYRANGDHLPADQQPPPRKKVKAGRPSDISPNGAQAGGPVPSSSSHARRAGEGPVGSPSATRDEPSPGRRKKVVRTSLDHGGSSHPTATGAPGQDDSRAPQQQQRAATSAAAKAARLLGLKWDEATGKWVP